MRVVGKPFKDFTLERAIRVGVAIGVLAGPRSLVVSGRDFTRVSRMLKRAITAGVMSVGAEVMDFHESLAGEISFAMKRFGAKMGFMVTADPAREGVAIRVYKSPGYEMLGDELKELLESAEKEAREPQEVGWVYYAEYMHKLYVAALSSFVKGDHISSRRPSTVIGPGVEPLGVVLEGLSGALGINQVVVGGVTTGLKYPNLVLMDRISRVVNALGAEFGALFSHEGSSVSLYVSKYGFLTPEELFLALLERYSPGSKVVALNPVSEVTVKAAVDKGFDVVILDNEVDFQKVVRRERPAIAFTWRGEYVTPVFSLGYDSVAIYPQLLEALSEAGNIFDLVLSAREKLNVETVNVEETLNICIEKSLEPTLWGCKVLIDGKLITYIYQPTIGSFIKVLDKVAPCTGK